MNNIFLLILIALPEVLLSHSEKSANDIEAKELLPEHSLEVLKRLKVKFVWERQTTMINLISGICIAVSSSLEYEDDIHI